MTRAVRQELRIIWSNLPRQNHVICYLTWRELQKTKTMLSPNEASPMARNPIIQESPISVETATALLNLANH